jgi:hypothetical protein
MLILLTRRGFVRHEWELGSPIASTLVHVCFFIDYYATPIRTIKTPTATTAIRINTEIQSEVGTRS